MPDTFLDTLREQQAVLETELRAVRDAIAAYQRRVGAAPHRDPTEEPGALRFAAMRPILAIEKILEQHGGRMNRDDLISELVAGGATAGKKRGVHNLRIAIDLNVKLGKLALEGADVLLVKH